MNLSSASQVLCQVIGSDHVAVIRDHLSVLSEVYVHMNLCSIMLLLVDFRQNLITCEGDNHQETMRI